MALLSGYAGAFETTAQSPQARPMAEDVNQLETTRLTQAAQRAEFGVEGEMTAFKFSFADPVRFSPSPLAARALRCSARDCLYIGNE